MVLNFETLIHNSTWDDLELDLFFFVRKKEGKKERMMEINTTIFLHDNTSNACWEIS